MFDGDIVYKTANENLYWATDLMPGKSYGFIITVIADNGALSAPSKQFIAATSKICDSNKQLD